MITKKIRIIAIVLAVIMTATFACGCRDNPEEVSIIYVDEDGNIIDGNSQSGEDTSNNETNSDATESSGDSDANDGEDTSNDNSEGSSEDSSKDSNSEDEDTSSKKNESKNNSSKKNSSSKDNSSKNDSSSKDNSSKTVSSKKNNSSKNASSKKNNSSKNASSKNNSSKNVSSSKAPDSTGKVDASKYRGTTVRFATWKNPDENEDGIVVDAFEKKYGIKVQVDTVPQGVYVNTIVGKIASEDAPDVYFSNYTFPADLKCLQPLDAAQLDLTDPIWDQDTIKLSTVGGKPYLVNTVGNIWSEIDCVFYNKKLLKENNITTPEEYYNAGKWTFAALEKVMTEVKNLGASYVGGYIDPRSLLGSTGASFFDFSNGKFSNSMDSKLTNVFTQYATWKKNGLVKGIYDTNRSEFIKGKVGIAITNVFGLKKTGYWRDMNPNDIGFTYMPAMDESSKAVPTGIMRGWGICKGAKNPVGAGLFLRYYLDVNNYDTASAFISGDAETFFFKVTDVNTSAKNLYLAQGISQAVGVDHWDFYDIVSSDPAQVSKELSAIKNKVDSTVTQANKLLADQEKLYK